MKKKVCYLLAIAMLATGCGKIPTLENGQEAVVTFKNGDKISVDELYKEVKDTYGLTSLMTLIDKYVMDKTFPDYIDTANEYVENYYKALEENYGGKDALLEALTQSGISSIEAYKDIIYLNYMQSHAVEEYAKDQITEKEIEKYYKNDFVGDIEVSHILITPETTDKMSKDEVAKAEEKAKEKVEKLIKELKATKKADLAKKFEELAKANSEDKATKDKAGSLGKINKNTLSSEYDELVTAAYKLKDGEFSTKVITTELGYHVIYRTKSHEKISLDKAKEDIIKTLSSQLMTEDKTLMVDALSHYRKELGMDIQDDELKTQYAYYIQNQLASLTQTDTKKE